MSYVRWKIEHTPFRDNQYQTGETAEITDFYDVLMSTELGDGRDTFSLKVNNQNGVYDNYFNSNDKFTIYRVVNGTSLVSTDVLMVGGLKDDQEKMTAKSDVINLEGYNFSESVMGALVFVDITNLTPPAAIEFALDNAAEKNSNFAVTWNTANDTAISSLTFPTISSERFFNKPLKKIIQKYSEDPETNNGSFLWYVDKDNTLVWRQKTSVITHDFNVNTDDFVEYEHGKDISGVRNFIVLKGGLDPAGRQITTRYIDWSSVAKHGSKYQFIISETNAGKNLVDLDLVKSYGTDNVSETYPDEFSNSLSFTTAWKSKYTYTTKQYSISVDKDYITINEGSDAANKKAYAEIIRTETKKRLVDEGTTFTATTAFGKLKMDVGFMAGSKSWILGENISVTNPKIASLPKTLRVSEVQYSSTVDTYSLEEDVGTI